MQEQRKPIRMVVGLGNPGKQYEGTPHNAGFLWIDRYLARPENGAVRLAESKKHEAETGSDPCGTLLVRPLTYMNLSGVAVAGILRNRPHGPDQMLVVHDEIDFPLGTARLKLGGGAAGHKGVGNIAERVGTPEFWRLRLGVGPAISGRDAADYVLGRLAPEGKALLASSIDRSLELAPLLFRGEFESATKRLHTAAAPRGEVA